jgi:aromatic-L-amino-acid/L-tryptophan decarboxylase
MRNPFAVGHRHRARVVPVTTHPQPTPPPLPPAAAGLELDGDGLRALVAAALDRLAPFLDSLPDQRASGVHPLPAGAVPVPAPLPHTGSPVDVVLDEIVDRASVAFNTTSPGFMAYVPGGGLPYAAVADLIAGVLNRYVGVAAAAPALVRLESDVLRWFGELIGYPDGAGGVFTSGGSMANFGGVIAARDARPGALARGTVYVSAEAHHAVTKAARLAGFGADRIRTIATDERYRIDAAVLEDALAADVRAGLEPCLIVGSAGTVNSGAVDDFDALADLAAAHDAWLHVDGAYGGFFAMTDAGRAALGGMTRADSIALDPHKTLFLPYGTGALLARDFERLRQADTHAAYLPDRDATLPDFSDYGPELTRPFRGLRVWLPFRLLGVDTFRDALNEKLELARWISDELARDPRLEIVAPPTLSILAFAVRADGATALERDALTRRLLDEVNARGRVLLTGTVLRGRFVARIAIVSFRTHMDRVVETRDIILESLDRVTRCSPVTQLPPAPRGRT